MGTTKNLTENGLQKAATFLTENFLLQSGAAKKLYHNYAASLPIIDYHNHLPPNEIAADKKFSTLTEIWLKSDHYKWRAMRTLGVDEKFITGDAGDEAKFKTWAAYVPATVRNPLFHWTHMELKNPFGISSYLNADTADKIYAHCNELLADDKFSARGLLSHFKAEMVCTTDDPCDNLNSHKKIAADKFTVKVLPGFRPDKVFNIANSNTFIGYIKKLEEVSGIIITGFRSLIEALEQRIDYFHQNGCRIADHGLAAMPSYFEFSKKSENELELFLAKKDPAAFSNPEAFTGAVLKELCKMYRKKGWVQQFHLGPLRNNNSRLFTKLGADSGFDSIGDISRAQNLSNFLNELDKTNELTKTVIYNINPADNEVYASMTGNFNDGSIKGKVQYGSGWWFLDQLDGMEKQINALSSIGIISTFIGMLTDSRSFLSFPRHEYFRRLLCNIFGNEMEKGLLPNDEKWIGKIVQDICYYNAKEYFNV
jgi:glucuronate isomerase